MTDHQAPHTEFIPDTGVVKRAPWTRVLLICVAAFLVWFLLFAPTIQHNAQVSPVGTRRTVGLDIVGPVAALSRTLQLSHIVSETDAATGRTGNRPGNGVGLVVEGPGGHHHRPPPPPVGGTTTSGPTSGSSTTTSSTTTVPDATHPTASRPLRVLIVGDSIGLDLGGPLQNDLAHTGVVEATLDGRESTGLTRPDYFNWPAELQSDMRTAQPQVVVIMMGANDPQDFPGPPDIPFTSSKWNPAYADRVSTFMQIAGAGGATVIWVGMPPMQNGGLSAEMSDINAVDQQQAAMHKPPVDYISCWTLLGTAQGGYTPFITNASGQVVNVRTPDGTHLTPAGGEVLSQTVINYLKGTLHYDLP
jgi:lysophospholipase L1-like esterase